MYQQGFELPLPYQGRHDISVFAIPAVDGMGRVFRLGVGRAA